MKYLFIGGSRDGQRIDVELVPYVKMIVERQYAHGEPVEVEEYKAIHITGQYYRTVVYICRAITSDDVLQALIDRYATQKEAQ